MKLLKIEIIRYIKILFEQEDDYYYSIKVDLFWNDNYIEYKR